jgi:glutamate carboxypeptidase
MQKHPALERAEQLMDSYIADLKAIVNIDSGTYNKAGVDWVGAYLQKRFHEFGFSTTFNHQQNYGDNLVATHKGSATKGQRILLIGHMDTVFPDGEAQRRPFAISERNGMHIAMGPGVLDMKSGLLIGLYGLHLLIEAQQAHYQSVTFICNSDEEIGSPGSKALIRELARQSDAVIVLEAGRAKSTIVSSRRGCGTSRIEVRGVSAHAGVALHEGRNAILELSYQVQALQALNGTIPGTSISVGVIGGGERINVVPDFAYCEMDVRATDQAGLHALEAAIRKVASKTMLDGTSITLISDMHFMPFERSPQNQPLIEMAQEAGRELGLKIEDVASGGASDANGTASMGIPTIDGLGAGGDLTHNPGEYVELDYLPIRIALLSGLVRIMSSKPISS